MESNGCSVFGRLRLGSFDHLPLLLICGFLALHLEGTVVHDACHKAAHPVPWVNQTMGHGSALLLGFSFPVFTRVHLQHHSHVNDPKHDPDHIVSTFGPLTSFSSFNASYGSVGS